MIALLDVLDIEESEFVSELTTRREVLVVLRVLHDVSTHGLLDAVLVEKGS